MAVYIPILHSAAIAKSQKLAIHDLPRSLFRILVADNGEPSWTETEPAKTQDPRQILACYVSTHPTATHGHLFAICMLVLRLRRCELHSKLGTYWTRTADIVAQAVLNNVCIRSNQERVAFFFFGGLDIKASSWRILQATSLHQRIQLGSRPSGCSGSGVAIKVR